MHTSACILCTLALRCILNTGGGIVLGGGEVQLYPSYVSFLYRHSYDIGKLDVAVLDTIHTCMYIQTQYKRMWICLLIPRQSSMSPG